MEKAKVKDQENVPQQTKGIKRKRSLKRHPGLTDISNFHSDLHRKDEIVTRSKAKRRRNLEQEEELRKKKEFDIDEDDTENPQCVTDYVEDIYKVTRALSVTFRFINVSTSFSVHENIGEPILHPCQGKGDSGKGHRVQKGPG